MRVGPVTVHAFCIVEPDAEHEIAGGLMRPDGDADRHRIAGLEDMRDLPGLVRECHAGDFNLARAPSPFVDARHVFEDRADLGFRTRSRWLLALHSLL